MTGRKQATCCVLVLLFCFLSIGASSYNGQTCSGDKPVDKTSYCPSSLKPVFDCQAAVDYPLRLVCSECSADITWQRWNVSSSYWQNISYTTTQALEFPAEVVGNSLTGCFRCLCYTSSPEGTAGRAVFSVDVQPAKPPKLLMPNTPEEHGEFILYPVTVNLVLNQQMVCFPFTSTGWPDVAYDMYYRPNPEEATTSLLLPTSLVWCKVKLCYIPPVSKHLRIGGFMSVVHNIAGNITALQSVGYNADPIWSIKPHPDQTAGNVTLDHESGVGKAVCAAYWEDPDVTLQYFVCQLPNGTTPEEAACRYYHSNLSCYMCGDGGAGFNSTKSDSVSDLGIETRSCLVDVWEEGQFVCLAQRQWMNGSTSIYQPIGNFTACKPVPQPIPRPCECNLYTPLHYGLITGVLFLFMIVVTLVCGCGCTWCVCLGICRRVCRKHSKCKNGYGAIEELEGPAGNPTASVSATNADEKTPLQKVVTWFKGAEKPETNSISVHLLHATSRVELPSRCREVLTASSSPWDMYNLDLDPGVKYNLEIRIGNITRKVLSIATPGIVEPEKPLPPDVDTLVPLDIKKLMPFVPGMAADYVVIGVLLGQETYVRDIKTTQQEASQKMAAILLEWKDTKEASWSALITALESYTPRLRGVASGIRMILRKEYENAKGGAVSQEPSAPPRLEVAGEPCS